MSIDSSGPVTGPIGLTIPPPQEEASVSEPVPESKIVPEPPSAPLPSYQGSVVDESV